MKMNEEELRQLRAERDRCLAEIAALEKAYAQQRHRLLASANKAKPMRQRLMALRQRAEHLALLINEANPEH